MLIGGEGRGAGRSVPVVWGSVRRPRVTGDEAAVAARKVDRFVTVVPEHAVMLRLLLALASPDFQHFAFAAGLADVGAFDDDPVTGFGVHDEPPFSGCPPSLDAARVTRWGRHVERPGSIVTAGSRWSPHQHRRRQPEEPGRSFDSARHTGIVVRELVWGVEGGVVGVYR